MHSTVKLVLEIDKHRIVSEGRVVWCFQIMFGNSQFSLYDTGIEFLGLTRENRDFIIQMVQKKGQS